MMTCTILIDGLVLVRRLLKIDFKFKYTQAARMAQWLERRRKDLIILASPVRIPLWDVGAGPSDETV